MKKTIGKVVGGVLLIAVIGLVFWRLSTGEETPAQAERGGGSRGGTVAVEVTPVERRDLQETRGFTGSLEARARFDVVARVPGQILELKFDIGDRVERGQVVSRLDTDEFVEQLRQTEAEREVAEANVAEAESELRLADRELERIRVLRGREIAAEADLETAEARLNAAEARLRVARGTLAQREAGVAMARLRLSQAEVRANWEADDEHLAVAERYVSEGGFVSANERLLSLVSLRTLRAVIFVTERDFGLLRRGQEAEVVVDAFPGERFTGTVARVAPVFEAGSRQARVEIDVENPDERLAPGMFARVRLGLREAPGSMAVPRDSIVRRNGREGVFQVGGEGDVARFIPVDAGIRDGRYVEIRAPELSGRIVTLGQGQLTDGATVRVIEREGVSPSVNGRMDR